MLRQFRTILPALCLLCSLPLSANAITITVDKPFPDVTGKMQNLKITKGVSRLKLHNTWFGFDSKTEIDICGHKGKIDQLIKYQDALVYLYIKEDTKYVKQMIILCDIETDKYSRPFSN